MRNPKSKKKTDRKQRRQSESQEISTLNAWIEHGKPDSGTNPISFPPPPRNAPVGRTPDGKFSAYVGCDRFSQLPLSSKTQDGLRSKFVEMSEIQRAALPHALAGRDVLGAAKTGSGKTLAFVIPILEKLYRSRWGPEDGVGSIIISPTKELAGQIFEVLKSVGKYHNFSAGLLIGGRKDVKEEQERVNCLNILICTPGRLLQHMDETPNFDCSQIQVLVLDEADRILDEGFKKDLDAIISQLPKRRQTLLFSATQTKSIGDLARLSLKDPEYLSVHAESLTVTPENLQQIVMEVPIGQKLDMLWSFIKTHINSKIIVFLSTRKQVKFVFEIFKKLRPGIPLQCLHGRMKQNVRLAVYSQFCESRSLLFATDVACRGLDFPSVDWVIQFDCPGDIPTYIHRVGRTARFTSKGKSVLFLLPSEKEMMKKLQATEPRIPVQLRKANTERLQTISDLVAAQLIKYRNLKELAQKAFIRYCRSVYKEKDKEVFDAYKLPLDEFALSLGLHQTPKIRFLSEKMKSQKPKEVRCPENSSSEDEEILVKSEAKVIPKSIHNINEYKKDKENDLYLKGNLTEVGKEKSTVLPTRILKKNKLKISLVRPVGSRVVFDDEGNQLPSLPLLAANSDGLRGEEMHLSSKVEERYKRYNKCKEEIQKHEEEDKLLQKKRLREGRLKEKMKIKRRREEDQEAEEDQSGSDSETQNGGGPKRFKVDLNSDDDEGERTGKQTNVADSISLAEQEALALKLLSSMHS